MKTNILLLVMAACIALSCNNNHNGNNGGGNHGYGDMHEYISIDSANKMLTSYLNSINANNNDTDLRSITIDADQLRIYLKDENVAKVKIMLAHRLDYINAGNKDVNCGYNYQGLTVILAGYDTSFNYVYSNKMVLDLGTPCPTSCPTLGTAASNILPAVQR